MTIETWLAFVAGTGVLLVIPGPTVLLVVSYALGRGFRTALPMAFGVALGDFTAMTLSMLGVGALKRALRDPAARIGRMGRLASPIRFVIDQTRLRLHGGRPVP